MKDNRSIIHFVAPILFTVLSVNCCYSQTRAAALNEYFSVLTDQYDFNGNVLVTEKNRVVYKRSVGYADIDSKRANNEHSEFQLASISKTFTSVAVLQLQERGRLNIDDKFVKYFPDFPYPTVSIRQMLSHTSGLPDYEIFEQRMAENPDKAFTNADIIPTMKVTKNPLQFQPGEKWSYCNLNFDLLALLVENLSHETFQNYLKQHIFAVSGMRSSYVKTALVNTENSQNLSYGYDYQFLFSTKLVRVAETFSIPIFKAEYYQQSFIGDANVYSTTEDLRKFDVALYNGKLLRSASLAPAFTPTKLSDGSNPVINIGGMGEASYGLGWFIFKDISNGKIVWHTGGMPGALTIFLRNLTKRQMVVVLDNFHVEGLYRMGLSAMNILNHKPSLLIRRSLARIYARELLEKGSAVATEHLMELKADTTNYNLSENEINNLGYDLMSNGHMSEALDTLLLNTKLFKDSYNVYDSYAEGLLKNGNFEEAARMYKRSLDLNPQNENAKEALKGISDKARAKQR